jgi:hypothetical protein
VPQPKRAKKERLTVSLSHSAVQYLEARCAQAQAPSMSAYLETLIRDVRAKAEMDAMEASTVAYYDSLTPAEMEEDSNWGRMGAATLSRREE